jgi:hypothetical protein
MSAKESRPQELPVARDTDATMRDKRKQRWEPPALRYIGTLDEIAMSGILKTGSSIDGSGGFKSGVG